MNGINEEGVWGVHLIEKLYSSFYPQPPKWVTGWNEERWSKLGVVIWDAQLHLVTHLRGSEVSITYLTCDSLICGSKKDY